MDFGNRGRRRRRPAAFGAGCLRTPQTGSRYMMSKLFSWTPIGWSRTTAIGAMPLGCGPSRVEAATNGKEGSLKCATDTAPSASRSLSAAVCHPLSVPGPTGHTPLIWRRSIHHLTRCALVAARARGAGICTSSARTILIEAVLAGGAVSRLHVTRTRGPTGITAWSAESARCS